MLLEMHDFTLDQDQSEAAGRDTCTCGLPKQNRHHFPDDLQARVVQVLALDSADHATKSRDYGRGFAEALRIVREILNP